MNFLEELEVLIDRTSNQVERKSVSNDQIAAILLTSDNISEDYITYLKKVGYGDLTLSSIKIYPALCDFSDFGLEDVYSVDDDIKFFGDNYSGDFLGFDLSNQKDEVLEFWHDSASINKTGKTFREYILEMAI